MNSANSPEPGLRATLLLGTASGLLPGEMWDGFFDQKMQDYTFMSGKHDRMKEENIEALFRKKLAVAAYCSRSLKAKLQTSV